MRQFWLHKVLDILWEQTLKPKSDFIMSLRMPPQKGTLMAQLPPSSLWRKETLPRKLLCLAMHKWQPSHTMLEKEADAAFMDEVFGEADDLGDQLLELMKDHNQLAWDFSSLSDEDQKRANALEVHAVATRKRFRHIRSEPSLNLNLVKRNDLICSLVYPMIVIMPVISLRYFVDIHASFVFNEIRKSNHPRADDLISFLYDLLFLQQKTAIALLDFSIASSVTNDTKTNDAILVDAETDAIMGADLIFPYLKASVEKTLALVAATHLIEKLDDKKTHKAKMEALQKGLPDSVRKQPYCGFLLEFVKSENLEDLNKYRTGLLHKKGIADLQPHNYVGVNPKSLPFKKVFAVLHEQHAKNSAVILAALALVTDELMRRSDQTFRDISNERLQSILNRVKKKQGASYGAPPECACKIGSLSKHIGSFCNR